MRNQSQSHRCLLARATRRTAFAALGVLVAALAWTPPTSAAETHDAEPVPSTREGSLEDMSLEELLEMRLGGMSITGIHHAHDAGEWMTGYSFMQMEMDGSLDGSHGAGRSDIFAEGFMVAPTSMQMQMHMFHLMYSPTSRMTLP